MLFAATVLLRSFLPIREPIRSLWTLTVVELQVPERLRFQDGVQLASSELPNVTFNWRGRTLTSGASCVTTFAVSDTMDHGLSVDVSGSGDVTVENQQPTLPNVTYNNTVNSSDSIDSRACS